MNAIISQTYISSRQVLVIETMHCCIFSEMLQDILMGQLMLSFSSCKNNVGAIILMACLEKSPLNRNNKTVTSAHYVIREAPEPQVNSRYACVV